MKQHVLLAKQPIYNQDLSLYGFELLFRNEQQSDALEVGEENATNQVLLNYFTSVSGDTNDNKHPIFINVSEHFLLSDISLPVNKTGVVLELLERIQLSDALLNAVKQLHQAGYQFALDDYDFDPKWAVLLPYVQFIKVDIQAIPPIQLSDKMAQHQHVPGTRWIAERIEDQATLNQCLELGFDYFQGYVLARPKEVLGNTIRGSSLVSMQIVKLASDPEADLNHIAQLVSQDPKLSMQLLKLINSPLFSLNRSISDLTQAITFLGTEQLKRWAMMIAFVASNQTPLEASRIILTRAKCCELYFAHHLKDNENVAAAFLAGLISGADLLLEVKPTRFIKEMNFSHLIHEAIDSGSGSIGTAIKQTKQIEYYLSQAFDQITDLNTEVLSYYSEAQHWAGEIMDSLTSNR